ncbi:hypothetical protein AUEXF2481DRAFT_48834 [Aureobasidium subglaciale EXF-2481]|uniref:Metallo-beta-lactamase domain-containing protein n=1 Tax=Aureobasidium subglaciale (strain EXF-2481) TaxID=1043005 RepID=A0A074Y7P8_AURSE|nr:uncharacterized protein AUEXF2481DRAFT_48834 [Aureobasidium subglaciale EXF-2481]KEQ90237.1 hypothetical protein AUEXF2481DRAFT_48834 [Aureobasidium subglaciale EXF-2481]
MSGTTLEWFGATTFRLKTRGLTIFLDTWLEKPDVLPHYLSIDQVTEADYIFISHAHFDHLPGCDRLAKQTGAIVIANGEAINTLREAGVSEDQLIPVAGGERIPLFTKATRLAALEDEVATAPGPPGAPRRPEDSLATMAVHAWPSLHCVLPGKSHADIPDEMNTATRYEGSSPYACTIDITIGMRYGLLRLSELVSPENLDQGERSFADYVSKRDVNIMSNFDGGQIMFSFLIGEKTLLWSAHLGAYRGILERLEPKPDVLIQAIAGRANIDGRPYDGSAAEAATMISELLGQPQQIIWCLHDEAPIKPWRIDTRAATSMVESKTKSRVLELTPGEAQYLFDV